MGKNSEKTKLLIVSIHDVCPPYFHEIKEITSILNNIGITKKCLKVIPNYLGKWNILKYPKFLEWILEEMKNGNEIIQHGYTHKNWKKSGKMLLNYFKKGGFSPNSSEFSQLNYNEAKKNIQEGRKIFERAGIKCKGFTSPTWSQNREATRAIIDCGFDYFTTFLWIKKIKNNKKIFLPASGFHGIYFPLELGAMIGNAIAEKIILPYQNCNRIVLHPQNFHKNKAFSFVIKILKRLINQRKLITYSEFIEYK
jgi:hypothetical protein